MKLNTKRFVGDDKVANAEMKTNPLTLHSSHFCFVALLSTNGAHNALHSQGANNSLKRLRFVSDTPCIRRYIGRKLAWNPYGRPVEHIVKKVIMVRVRI